MRKIKRTIPMIKIRSHEVTIMFVIFSKSLVYQLSIYVAKHLSKKLTRMMVPGQISPDVLNMSLVYKSRYLAPVLEFLDTVHRYNKTYLYI